MKTYALTCDKGYSHRKIGSASILFSTKKQHFN